VNVAENKTIEINLPVTEKPGDKIGHYKLLQQIGEGGCGMVYMAEQEEPVRRRVALKVIKLGMDTKSVIARFEAERQALAMMDHPNIAKVLDAGATETGRPFFVMELVRGIKITEYCDQNNLSTRERLGLFIQVCHAIQHAHQKGIIHRDIKPSNILVTLHDGVPVPKVIDFGIAKATQGRLTDQTLFTAFEQFIGTPAYMSPEQAEMSGLDIDTRSDIYALGVLLYELLTGQTPFDPKTLVASGLDQMRRTIREQEPQRPSTRLSTMVDSDLTTTAKHRQTDAPKLIHLLRGDLDWIAMKALEKDRTRRYETANGLATDVQRYLSNDPITARPPSSLYRFQKLIRRNKLAFAAGAAVAAALILGTTISTALFIQERKARKRADEAERTQADLRKKAEIGLALEKERREAAQAGQKYSEAGLLLSQGEYDKAEALVWQVPPRPAAAALYQVLGMVHARRGQWSGAVSNFALVVELAPTNHMAYHLLAPLLVQVDDIAGYRRHCARILRQFGTAPEPFIAERMAKDCLLVPPASADLETLSKMADTAISAGPGQGGWPYFQLVKGLAEYRLGHFTNALEHLARVQAWSGKPDPYRTTQADLIVAMAQYQLGQKDQARATLSTAVERINTKLAKLERGLDEQWDDWLRVQILLREAKGID
jgi:serine/threonine protein kinase/Flp pilus assembly protein TadD